MIDARKNLRIAHCHVHLLGYNLPHHWFAVFLRHPVPRLVQEWWQRMSQCSHPNSVLTLFAFPWNDVLWTFESRAAPSKVHFFRAVRLNFLRWRFVHPDLSEWLVECPPFIEGPLQCRLALRCQCSLLFCLGSLPWFLVGSGGHLPAELVPRLLHKSLIWSKMCVRTVCVCALFVCAHCSFVYLYIYVLYIYIYIHTWCRP